MSNERLVRLSKIKPGGEVKVYPRGGGVKPFTTKVVDGEKTGIEGNRNIPVQTVVVEENKPQLEKLSLPVGPTQVTKSHKISYLSENTPVRKV